MGVLLWVFAGAESNIRNISRSACVTVSAVPVSLKTGSWLRGEMKSMSIPKFCFSRAIPVCLAPMINPALFMGMENDFMNGLGWFMLGVVLGWYEVVVVVGW